MTLRDALDFALTSLRGNLAKSLLTVLGLGVGVGAVLTVLSLGDAGEIRVEEEIARLGVDKVWFCAENPAVLLQTIRSRCVEVKLFPTVEEGGAPDELTLELARLIAEGSRASRAAFLAKLETQKVTRDDLSSLFEGTRLLLSSALLGQYGVSVPERDLRIARSLASRLTKAKLLGTIDLLQDYRNKCTYNVGVGPTLGGFAVELEDRRCQT